MKVDIYTKASCPACIFAKNYMERRGMIYEEHIVDKDIPVDEVRKLFPQATTVPIIVIDENFVGGYPELAEFVEKAA